MKEILKINNVSKTFKTFNLKNINISIKENCITGLIGKNGAGKTTLIKIILGLLHKDEGDIIYFNNPDLSEKHIKDRIGVVLDEGYFYDTLTLNQMKELVSSTYSDWDENNYRSYLERFRLDGKQIISNLSKGMKMKYALSLALSHNADLLIMDEPTSGLDPEIRKELMDILKEYIQEDGKSIIFSTHITSDLERIADEIIIINDGKILEQISKDELLEEYRCIKGNNEVLEKLNKLNKYDLNYVNKTKYGFSAITNKYEQIRKEIPEIIIERTNLEDIFLARTEVN